MNYYIKQALLQPKPKDLENEIIKYFGKEKIRELEVAEELQEFLNKIFKEYLFIEPIPVIFDHTIKCTALYHIELDAIIIHPKNINNKSRLLVSVLHEAEHAFQLFYANNFNTPKAKRWGKELENYTTNPKHYYNQEIELDAIAFSQVVMLEEFNIKVESPNKKLQNKVNKYKIKLLEN